MTSLGRRGNKLYASRKEFLSSVFLWKLCKIFDVHVINSDLIELLLILLMLCHTTEPKTTKLEKYSTKRLRATNYATIINVA